VLHSIKDLKDKIQDYEKVLLTLNSGEIEISVLRTQETYTVRKFKGKKWSFLKEGEPNELIVSVILYKSGPRTQGRLEVNI